MAVPTVHGKWTNAIKSNHASYPSSDWCINLQVTHMVMPILRSKCTRWCRSRPPVAAGPACCHRTSTSRTEITDRKLQIVLYLPVESLSEMRHTRWIWTYVKHTFLFFFAFLKSSVWIHSLPIARPKQAGCTLYYSQALLQFLDNPEHFCRFPAIFPSRSANLAWEGSRDCIVGWRNKRAQSFENTYYIFAMLS